MPTSRSSRTRPADRVEPTGLAVEEFSLLAEPRAVDGGGRRNTALMPTVLEHHSIIQHQGSSSGRDVEQHHEILHYVEILVESVPSQEFDSPEKGGEICPVATKQAHGDLLPGVLARSGSAEAIVIFDSVDERQVRSAILIDHLHAGLDDRCPGEL